MRSRILLLVMPALVAMTLMMSTGHADPRDRFALEDRIPATSLGMVSLEDVGSWESRLEKTAVGAFLADPEVKAFANPLIEDIKNMLESREGGGPLRDVPPMIKELFKQLEGLKGQLAVAVVDVRPGQDLPDIVASLDFGPNTKDFVAFLMRVKEELGEEGDALQTYERDGRVWFKLDTGGPVVTATVIDTAFVVATRPELLDGVLAAGHDTRSLSKDATFQGVRRKLGGDDLGLMVYANVPAIVGLFEERMNERTRRMANAFGLDTVKAAGYGLSWQGDGFMDTIVVETPGADHGLAMLAAMPPAKPKALKFVPRTAFLYEETSLQTSELLGRIRKIVTDIDPEAVAKLDEGLAKVSDRLGVDLEQDILAGLGDGTAFYAAMPEHGGVYPELCIMLPLKDAASYEGKFASMVDGLAAMVTEQGRVKMSTRDLAFRDETLHLVELEKARGDDPFPFTPTWVVRDGYLFITLVPYSMKDVLLRQIEGDDPSQGLMSQEDFKDLYDAIPGDTGGFSYLDLKGIVSLLYGTGVPLAQTLVKPNMMNIPFRLDFDHLPTARTVQKHFRSIAGYTGWTQDGIRVSVRGPIPVIGAVVAIGAGAAFFVGARAMPPGMRRGNRLMPPRPMPVQPPIRLAEPDLNVELARVNLQEISRYVRLFTIEKNRMPKTLDELVDSGTIPSLNKDPWQTPYKLNVTDAPERQFEVVSAGPDKQFGTPDDLRIQVK